MNGKDFSDRQPVVSVIVPGYNHGSYLRQRIESVLNQTYSDFELILLDDCSSDDSRSILAGYRNHDRVSHILLNETNSGSTFLQWKKGISHARGKYIWIAESDDYCERDFLEKAVTAMEAAKGASMAFCNSFLVDSQGDDLAVDLDTDDTLRKGYDVWEGKDFLMKKMLYKNRIYNASAVVFKASAWEKADKGFKAYKLCGDWFFWIEALLQGEVVWLHEKLNYFRIHTNKVTPRAIAEGLDFREYLALFRHICMRLSLPAWTRYCCCGNVYLHVLTSDKIDRTVKRAITACWKAEFPFRYFYMICYGAHHLINACGRYFRATRVKGRI